ncbi:protein LURP-one-related 15-like [Lolium perenne]|uniref:protein LURP-one-related 15-like n=1 Tax=Lolium perenne TaxID=4522 RepID=UPI0021F547CB|nr:protein LURP-one-related 15-like [Lolium perenne]
MAARNGAPPAKLPMSGPQICKPFVGPLTVTKKAFGLSVGDYNVTDASGVVVLRVKGEFFSSRRRRVVLDADGRLLLTMRGKAFSFHSSWEVFRGGSTNGSNLLFTVKRSSVIQLNASLDIFLAANRAEKVCDFKIKGSYFNRSCAFYHGTTNIMIAQMNRQFVLLGKDSCTVTIIPNVDHAFITSLVVILDEINQ